MKWTKLKHLSEQRIASSIRPRFAINCAAYGACLCGHAWITLDKKVVANFCIRVFWNIPRMFDESNKKWVSKDPELTNRIASANSDELSNYGELSRQDAYEACWEFVHDLRSEQALNSEDSLIQTLAVIDKRRLKEIEAENLHPFAKKLLLERCIAENVETKLKEKHE